MRGARHWWQRKRAARLGRDVPAPRDERDAPRVGAVGAKTQDRLRFSTGVSGSDGACGFSWESAAASSGVAAAASRLPGSGTTVGRGGVVGGGAGVGSYEVFHAVSSP